MIMPWHVEVISLLKWKDKGTADFLLVENERDLVVHLVVFEFFTGEKNFFGNIDF